MTDDVPCRICGASREAHGTFWNHDHRYRATIYCVADHAELTEATWFVNRIAYCSTHKGQVMRAVNADPQLEADFHRIDEGYRP